MTIHGTCQQSYRDDPGESLGLMCPLRKVRTKKLRSNPVEKHPGISVDDEVKPSQLCALAAKAANSSLNLRELIIPLYFALIRRQFGPPQYKKTLIN